MLDMIIFFYFYSKKLNSIPRNEAFLYLPGIPYFAACCCIFVTSVIFYIVSHRAMRNQTFIAQPEISFFFFFWQLFSSLKVHGNVYAETCIFSDLWKREVVHVTRGCSVSDSDSVAQEPVTKATHLKEKHGLHDREQEHRDSRLGL